MAPLALKLALALCCLGSAYAIPAETDATVQPAGVASAAPSKTTQVVILDDGSCCYSYSGYTFCIDASSPPPDAVCFELCGVTVCVFVSSTSGNATAALPPKFVQEPSNPDDYSTQCCVCVQVEFVGINVCLEPANSSILCTPDQCGYSLCFGLCLDEDQAGEP